MVPNSIKELAKSFSVPVATVFLFIFTFRETYDFLIYKNAALLSQIIGMSASASYITYIGPDHIIREGGPFHVILKPLGVKPGFHSSFICGCIWALLSFAFFAALVNTDWRPKDPIAVFSYLLYALQYACATASLGFFISSAASKKDTPNTDINESESQELPDE